MGSVFCEVCFSVKECGSTVNIVHLGQLPVCSGCETQIKVVPDAYFAIYTSDDKIFSSFQDFLEYQKTHPRITMGFGPKQCEFSDISLFKKECINMYEELEEKPVLWNPPADWWKTQTALYDSEVNYLSKKRKICAEMCGVEG